MQPTVWKEEEQHLEETLQEIDRNIEQYSREAAMLREENQERYDTYRSSDSDMHNDLVVGLSWEDQVRFLLRQNRYAADKPYFGRIDYKETQEANGESFSLYIGKHGVPNAAINLWSWTGERRFPVYIMIATWERVPIWRRMARESLYGLT